MATGIRPAPSKGGTPRDGQRRRCEAGFDASVYLGPEGSKVRKALERESEAKAWRAETLTAAGQGKLKPPSRLTVEEAAWLWLEAARNGSVRDRSGNVYKPGTLREYERS